MSLLANPAQEEAIRTIDGPVLVVSCPGSGKTTTLVRRINHILKSGVPAASVLMVTFTREAAAGMAEKYTSLFRENPGVAFATIHSLCFNLLKREGRVRNEDVLSENEKMQFFSRFLKSKGYYKEAWDMSVSAVTAISASKNNYLKSSDMTVQGFPKELFCELSECYAAWCRERGAIDFDDMLLLCKEMLEQDPAVLVRYQKAFRYIQCDEYQDTNYIQRDILYLLSADNHNLCVVGDDDQSIYAFRGARPEIMLNFPKDFPEAKVIRMGTNYRSASSIVEASDRLIRKNAVRFDKEFLSQRGASGLAGHVCVRNAKTKKGEMKEILEQIQQAHASGVPYSEMAVLFRTNVQAQHPVAALSDAGIPYYSTENVRCMYESFIFDDIRDYASLACGTGKTDAMLRVLNHPNRYLKETAFRRVPYTKDGLLRGASYLLQTGEHWRFDNAEKSIGSWIRNFGPGTMNMDTEPSVIFRRFTGKGSIHYDKYIADYARNRNLDHADLLQMYKDLESDAGKYRTIREWFTAAEIYTIRLHEELKKKDRDGVMITTMHRAKGLEWQYVFIIDADEYVIPHRKSMKDAASVEEERRLFYVAMTRAKDELFIWSVDTPSRFIREFKTKSAGLSKTGSVIRPEDVPKKLSGHGVKHTKYGMGYVVRYEPGRIIVRFPDDGEKTFQFPETFCRGLLSYC